MLRTRVGYAGGSTADPTYRDLADHTEVFQLDFDPSRLAYGELVAEIWKNRRGGRAFGRHQYMEAVFAESPEQARLAREIVDDRAPIIDGARFYLAEDYHQKYKLRHDAVLMRELADYTPRELVDSTIAARLNGYVGGHGSRAAIEADLAQFGLSPGATIHVARLVR